MTDRRTLEFARLEDVMPDVDRLLTGHRMTGNWSLGQVCNHLAGVIRLSVEGSETRAPWLIRATIGRSQKAKILGEGRMKTGFQLPEAFLPRPGLDDRAEAEALRATIAHYLAHPGPRALHPFFGRMKGDEWDRLHRIHCAHHLSFAVPA
jgi:hypothetical protein